MNFERLRQRIRIICEKPITQQTLEKGVETPKQRN